MLYGVSPETSRRYAKRLSVEERRPQLLDAALRVIVEDGYRGATLNAIAERAGVSKPVIYSAFGDRDTFLLALLDREEARALDAIRRALPDVAEVQDRDALAAAIATGVAGFLRAVAAEPDPWRLILTESDATPPAMRDRIARDREVVHRGLVDVVRAGAGMVDADLDADLVAHAFFAVVERYARLAVEAPDQLDADAAARVVAALATGS